MQPERHQLRRLRERLGIRQRTLAAEMGKTAAWVCMIETGHPEAVLTPTYARMWVEAIERIQSRRQAELNAVLEYLHKSVVTGC